MYKSRLYDPLLGLFSKLGELSIALKEAIVENSEIVRYKKNFLMLSEGQKSERIYFIVSGAVRVFYLNKEGIETNTWFLFENELVISVYSFRRC